jgi:hypothetical protein
MDCSHALRIFMRQIVLPAALLVLVFCAAAWSAGFRLGSFDVENRDNSIVVRWHAEVEEGVREYSLQRRTPYTSSNDFVAVQTFPPKGAGKVYVYVDENVYKAMADQVDYRIEVLFTDPSMGAVVTPLKSVNYTSTAVRRTWGSIKAMFQ